MTQQYRLASTAAWLSSTGISHHSLLPHVPSCLPTVNSRPRPGIAPQSLCSSSQLLWLLGDPCPCPQVLVASAGIVCVILIPFSLPQISCFTHSLKYFSSNPNSCPDVGIRPLLQFPHLLRAGPVLPTLLFFPQFLHLTEFYAALYTLFCWSGTPVCSQLVFCMHFCV